jgi:hypothetical protein
MARSIDYWNQVIITQIEGTSGLEALNSTSKVSIWRLFTYCVAFCAWTLDKLFDSHQAEVSDLLTKQKPHRESWYRDKALNFQYGYSLPDEADIYDNTGISDDDIEASLVVKYSAVTQATNESRLVIKIAGETGDALTPITDGQFDAFKEYMGRVKDAGVFITFINSLPDRLYIQLRVYYDPLILDETGNNILTGGKPVEDALTEFMKELPFNGELILASMVDKLQKVSGVKIPQLDAVSYSALDPDLDDYGPQLFIDVKQKPVAGYFEIVNFDNVTYLPYV